MTNKKQKTFSVIIINYNDSAYLPEVLDAALTQTVPFDEIVVVDDGSTDNSVSLIKERIANIPHAFLVQNPKNLGIIPTLNAGLNAATGDFILIMSAGDSYSRHIVEWCHQAVEQYPDVAMIAGNCRIANHDTGIERNFILPFEQKLQRLTSSEIENVSKTRAFTFYGGAEAMRRDAMIAAGGYLEGLKWHSDWFLYLLLASRHPFATIPEEFICIKQAKEQYSSASSDWTKQKTVIETFIRTLRQKYPNEYKFFRKCGLLPTYDIETLFLLLNNKELRGYLTPLLVWRLLTYKPLRTIGRLFSDDMRAKLRPLLRV